MAWIAEPVYQITVSFKDETGSRAVTSAYVRQGVIFSDVLIRAQSFANTLKAVSNAAVVSYTVSRSWAETEVAPAAGSRVERKGRLVWGAGAYRTRMDVPSVNPSLVLQDGALNRGLDSPTMVALETLVLTDFAGDFTDSRGTSIDALVAAYEAYQRSSQNRLPARRLER